MDTPPKLTWRDDLVDTVCDNEDTCDIVVCEVVIGDILIFCIIRILRGAGPISFISANLENSTVRQDTVFTVLNTVAITGLLE